MDLNFNLEDFLDELRGLDQNNIGSWPLWAYVGAIVIVVALILGAGTWYLVLPKVEELKEAQQQEQALREEFKRKHEKVANLDAYKAQLAKMKRQFGKLLNQLPDESEVPKLLNAIARARQASGLEEELFKPRPEIRKDFYVVLPISLRVTGSYHELATFVSKVTSLPRIVTLDNVTIRPVNSGGDFKGELRMSVTAKTYRYIDNDKANGGG